MRRFKFLCLGLSLICFAAAGQASFTAPLALAFGGAGRGAAFAGAEYHLLNPAGLSLLKRPQAAGFYVFGEDLKPYWGVSFAESMHTPAAVSFIKNWEQETNQLTLSLAGLILPGWSLGISFTRRQNIQNTNWNVQTGILIKPKGQNRFSLGVVWDHLLPQEGGFKDQGRMGGGAYYKVNKTINLRADALYNTSFKNWTVIGGVESTFSRFLALRAAFKWSEQQNTFFYSGGIGLEGKALQADYSLSQNKQNGLTHAWNIRSVF